MKLPKFAWTKGYVDNLFGPQWYVPFLRAQGESLAIQLGGVLQYFLRSSGGGVLQTVTALNMASGPILSVFP